LSINNQNILSYSITLLVLKNVYPIERAVKNEF